MNPQQLQQLQDDIRALIHEEADNEQHGREGEIKIQLTAWGQFAFRIRVGIAIAKAIHDGAPLDEGALFMKFLRGAVDHAVISTLALATTGTLVDMPLTGPLCQCSKCRIARGETTAEAHHAEASGLLRQDLAELLADENTAEPLELLQRIAAARQELPADLPYGLGDEAHALLDAAAARAAERLCAAP